MRAKEVKITPDRTIPGKVKESGNDVKDDALNQMMKWLNKNSLALGALFCFA